jgi:hypothetical protein
VNRCAAAAAALLACALALPARADGLLSTLHVGAQAGAMSGIGPQGAPLGHGPYLGVCAFGESAFGMQLGGNLEFASSNDVLHTKFTSLGLFARLSPTPEDYRAYVQLGGGLYHAHYAPAPGYFAPAGVWRPGGSFGVGWDIFEQPRWAAGLLVNYNGVLFGRSAARSWVSMAVNVTLQRAAY